MTSNELVSQEQSYFAGSVHKAEEEQDTKARLEQFLQPEEKAMPREEHSRYPALQKMETYQTQGSFKREPLLDAQQLPRSVQVASEAFSKQPPVIRELTKTSDGSSESDSSSGAEEEDWDSDRSLSSVEAAAHSTPIKSEDSLSHSSVDVVRSTPTTTVAAAKALKPPLPPGKPHGKPPVRPSQTKKKKQNGSNGSSSSSKQSATSMPERYRCGGMPDRREFLADRGNYFALFTMVEKQRKLWVERVVSGRAEASLNSMLHDAVRKAKEAEAEIYKTSKNLEEYNANLLTYSTLQAEKVQNGVNRKAPF